MIGSIHFKNFRVLRDAILPLSPFTLIVGPNGSGKSTVFLALQAQRTPEGFPADSLLSVGCHRSQQVGIEIEGARSETGTKCIIRLTPTRSNNFVGGRGHILAQRLRNSRIYSLDPLITAAPVHLSPGVELGYRGENLAGVLDSLRDSVPERFEALNTELGHWLPEFDRVLFETPSTGQRAIRLRTREGHHAIPASSLSQGTLVALAILTLAYLPNPPSIIGLEEPDRGLHPRLLRDVRDAIYRLTNPAAFGEKREPVQVIATTHSPFFLDLFRDHPEEIVIAEKVGLEARFQRLSDRADLDEILGDASLGEVWYSGVLGGVPATT